MGSSLKARAETELQSFFLARNRSLRQQVLWSVSWQMLSADHSVVFIQVQHGGSGHGPYAETHPGDELRGVPDKELPETLPESLQGVVHGGVQQEGVEVFAIALRQTTCFTHMCEALMGKYIAVFTGCQRP